MRVSSLQSLSMCPGFAVIRQAEALMGRTPGGTAAQSGSAVGKVIELWHRQGEDIHRLPQAVSAAASTPEMAEMGSVDWSLVNHWALHYAMDPRNHGVVEADTQEAEVTLEIPCDPGDPTGEPVRLIGHVDQIRAAGAHLEVWDLKSGKPSGSEMVKSYWWQIAAYSAACTATWGRTVLPGGILRLRGYGPTRKEIAPATANAHYRIPATVDQVADALACIAHDVGVVRAALHDPEGDVPRRPGLQCMWCPGSEPWLCEPRVHASLAALRASRTPMPGTELDPILISQLQYLSPCAGNTVLETPTKPGTSLPVIDNATVAAFKALGRTTR